MQTRSLFTVLLGSSVLVSCTHTGIATNSQQNKISEDEPSYSLAKNALFHTIAQQPSPKAKDLAAILAMQGEYKVNFSFKETAILSDNYERYPKKDAGAFETVFVIEQTDKKISLQHVLVVGGEHVVKHWRQDWLFESPQRFEFTEDQTWRLKNIPKDKQAGHWTQCVYEVSDAPRYCGTGKWNHRYGVSTWTSDRTWRPLPRREYTIRNDYNALNVENRHTVTPLGWTHEQDNTKVVRSGEKTQKTLVRESGFNDYRRVDNYDFSPAYAYWKATRAYWAAVRTMWDQRFQQYGVVAINTNVDGMPIITATFSKADAIANGTSDIPSAKAINKALSEWIGQKYLASNALTKTSAY